MLTNWSISQVQSYRSLASVQPTPPLSPDLTSTFSLLDTAAEQLIVQRDFRRAFDTCERGLESLTNIDKEDSRHGEFKAAICVLGIQGLAELNQWRGVLSWILQHYGCPEKIPVKIMQMCILLHTKVNEPFVMHDAARLWLHCPSNRMSAGFGSVAELYLLHILVPLRQIEQAHELVLGEVGSIAFTEDQRQTALNFVTTKENESQELQLQSPFNSHSLEMNTELYSPQGAVIWRIEAIRRLLLRGLSIASAWSYPFRRILLAIFLLCILFIRTDPAHPSSFHWILKLLQILKRMWNTMF